jgi:hypothetical protein
MSYSQRWISICKDDEAYHHQLSDLANHHDDYVVDPVSSGERTHRIIIGEGRLVSAVGILRRKGEGWQIASASPLPLIHSRNELEISYHDPIQEEDGELESIITAITKDGTEVTFRCPFWLSHRDQMESGRFIFGLSVVATHLKRADDKIVITEGSFFEEEKRRRIREDPDFDPSSFTSLEMDMRESRLFMPEHDDISSFQAPIESAQPFEDLGTRGWILELNLIPPDREPLRVQVVAPVSILDGYVPAVGDLILASGFFQGVPLKQVETDDSWLDLQEPADDGSSERFMRMISFLFQNPQLPIGILGMGAAISYAGWEILHIAEEAFCDWAPIIFARDGEDRFWIFIRSRILGFCEAEPFSEQLRSEIAALPRAQGVRCLFVTVTLEPDRHLYRLSADGLEEFEDILKVPLEVAKPGEQRILHIGGAEPPEPVFDEDAALKILATGLSRQHLAEFSKLLHEDLVYESASADVTIRGRYQYLSYLGTCFDRWGREGRKIISSTGRVTYEGISHRCVISSFVGSDFPMACTILKATKDRIQTILNLPKEYIRASIPDHLAE